VFFCSWTSDCGIIDFWKKLILFLSRRIKSLVFLILNVLAWWLLSHAHNMFGEMSVRLLEALLV
jgi:hypothetical protein